MDRLGKRHLMVAYIALKYLKKAPGQGIMMKSDSKLRIYAYLDSDWVGCPETKRSITGYCILIG